MSPGIHLRSLCEEALEQFSQMEKLSALGELASGVAHDFNNTVAGILGRAQLILRCDYRVGRSCWF